MPNLFRRSIAVAIALAASLCLVTAASAANLESFYGHFQGNGIVQSPDNAYFGFTNRDLDVQIGAEGDGFFVEWTTVMRDVSEQHVRRKNTRISFEPSGRPGIYVQRPAEADRSSGMSWATLDGDTLTVCVVTILANGTYDVQTYYRTLSKRGMTLFFRSDRDGQTIRLVTANLTKKAD